MLEPRIEITELQLRLNPNFETGLSDEQATVQLRSYGKNVLIPKKKTRRLGYLAFLKEPMVWLLGIAALVYYLLGEAVDALITGVAIIPIGLIDVVIDVRTEKALERLESLGEPKVTVVRNGSRARISSEELVPGDKLLVKEGEMVMADSAIIDSTEFRVDESPLTGESQPVDKNAEEYYSEEFFGNNGAIFAGTRVLNGRATCLVVKTGSATFYGKIGEVLAKTENVKTKLQLDIEWIVKWFGIAAVGLSLGLILLQLYLGASLSAAILSGVSLAIAAIPEELPVVFTLFLTLGMVGLARNNALVKKLPAVEALGSVNVVCTDKTGTLTTGRTAIMEISTDQRYNLEDFLKKNASDDFMLYALMASEKEPADYMESAIHETARKTRAPDMLKDWDLVVEYPFDPKKKYMSHIWRNKGRLVLSAKGAVEAILSHCQVGEDQARKVLSLNSEMGEEGIRVIALAHKRLDAPGTRDTDEAGLAFSGLIGFYDPLRESIPASVAEAQSAGVRVVMLTGDHRTTAHAIAHKAGIEHDEVIEGSELAKMGPEEFAGTVEKYNVFSRVLPEQKLRIVETLQDLGYSVAVTGDGINDAPALKRADIGVAMGERGTEVAKEAASLLLLDDNFKTIIGAIRNGRRIYDNLQKAFGYVVSFHLPIFFSALIIPILKLPLLLVPIDIVILELVLHPVVSIAFEEQPAEEGIMRRRPRNRKSPILEKGQMIRLLLIGALVFLFSLAAYAWSYTAGYGETTARALGLTVMLFGQLSSMPSELNGETRGVSRLFKNKFFLGITLVVVVSYILVMYTPFLAEAVKISALPVGDWLFVGLTSGATLVFAELSKTKNSNR